MTKSKRIVQIQEGNFIEGIVTALSKKYPSLDKGNLETIVAQQIGNHRVLNSVVLSDHDYQSLLRDANISTERNHIVRCANRIHECVIAGKDTPSQILEVLQTSLDTNTTYTSESLTEEGMLEAKRDFAKALLKGVMGDLPVNQSNLISMQINEGELLKTTSDNIHGFFQNKDTQLNQLQYVWMEAYLHLAKSILSDSKLINSIREEMETCADLHAGRNYVVSSILNNLDRARTRRNLDRDTEHQQIISGEKIDVIISIADFLDPGSNNRDNIIAIIDDFDGEEQNEAIKQYFENIVAAYAASSGSKSLVAVMSAFVGKMSEQSDTMFVQKFLTGKQYEAVSEVVNILRHELDRAGVFSFSLEEFNKINNCMPHIGQKDLGITLSRSAEGDLMLQFNGVQNVSKL